MPSPKVQPGRHDRCRNCHQLIVYRSYMTPVTETGWSGKTSTYDKRIIRWEHELGKQGEPKTYVLDCNPAKLLPTEDRENWSYPYRDRAQPHSFCIENTYNGFSSSTCHRPVKYPDLLMCGIHGGAIKRAKEKQARERENQALHEWEVAGIKKLCDRLAELGVEDAKVHFGRQLTHDWRHCESTVTGRVTVDPEQLIALLELEEDEF